jgi:hypothetical protein
MHDAQNVLARLVRLRQRDLHDFLRDALDLDVHLQRGDAVVGARHLEIHVAEVIFVAEDVGQHGEAVAVLDQAHRDAGHVRLHRHAGVHQRERAAADGRHRRLEPFDSVISDTTRIE